MASRLVTVVLNSGEATLDAAASQLGWDVGDLDAGFGVVEIDPGHNLYVVLVQGDRVDGRARKDRLFSNPTIGTFGPDEDG